MILKKRVNRWAYQSGQKWLPTIMVIITTLLMASCERPLGGSDVEMIPSTPKPEIPASSNFLTPPLVVSLTPAPSEVQDEQGVVVDGEGSVPALIFPSPVPAEAAQFQIIATPEQVAEVTCSGPPADWVEYTIQFGDTLSALALYSGSSVIELQQGNCLPDSTLIAGALVYLPQIPPSPTAIRAQTTAVPTNTNVPEVAAVIPTNTALPPTPVPISNPTLPEESTGLLWFLWIVMLALLLGALVWVWSQRRAAGQ